MSKRSSRAGSSIKVSDSTTLVADAGGEAEKSADILQPATNRFGNLLFESSGTFFQDEEINQPGTSPTGSADGSRLAKILEGKRPPAENATPVSVSKSETDLSLNAPSFTPIAQKKVAPAPVVPSSTPRSPEPTLNIQWIYLDPKGERQGPFTTSQMVTWFNAGYFPANLPVAWYMTGEILDPDATFYPLDRCYAHGAAPFSGIPSRPVLSPKANPPPPAPIQTPKPSVPVSRPEIVRPPPSKNQAPTAPQPSHAKGWLWSPEEDAKLSASKQSASMSLADIMKAESEKKKGNQGRK